MTTLFLKSDKFKAKRRVDLKQVIHIKEKIWMNSNLIAMNINKER
jgi:hypothetical protein